MNKRQFLNRFQERVQNHSEKVSNALRRVANVRKSLAYVRFTALEYLLGVPAPLVRPLSSTLSRNQGLSSRWWHPTCSGSHAEGCPLRRPPAPPSTVPVEMPEKPY